MMPWYRMHGALVHLHMGRAAAKKAPAPCCARIASNVGGKPEVRCMAISSFLCDWKLEDGRTCDAPLCPDHAHEMGPDKHLCGMHFALHGAGAA
jgi:hypothetical protein